MEFSFNNVGVEKVSSVPMKGRSWSRREMSEVLSEVSFSLASEAMAYVDKPAPMPSAVLAVRKPRRPMGFMSVPLFRRLCGEVSVRHPSARCFRGLRVLLAHRGSAQVEEPLAGAQRLWWS